MSASDHSSATDIETGSQNEAPKLSALFLVKFDQKVGYTVAWKRSSAQVPLDNAVEYKSLPSGLHTVKSDLVYFVHEEYAGLSAFCNGEASEAERNAQFVAVGVLVPLSYGRLGRSWLHAPKLQELANTLANDPNNTAPLQAFWEEQSTSRPSASSPKPEQPKGHSRTRALSALTAGSPPDQSLPPYHPALAIVQYIDTFGPLVYRLQQAALLRKRILFVGAPPVRSACEFVYNLSLLSSIPNSASELLSPGTDSLVRLRSLFSLGIHDIPFLEKLRKPESNGRPSSDYEPPAQGWVACTTDEIIATKTKLYDIIVEIPTSSHEAPEKRRWPTIRTSDGMHIRASQRDLGRCRLLHNELWKYKHGAVKADGDAEPDEEESLLPHNDSSAVDDDFNETYDDKTVEPMTWTRYTYLGFMWWASAGEQDAYTTAERERDGEILGDLSDYQDGLHTAIIAYFHRTTLALIRNLAELVEAADDDDGESGEVLAVSRDDISRIGLDTWSETDKAFIQEFLSMYFGRTAEVHGAKLECCGVRIPVF